MMRLITTLVILAGLVGGGFYLYSDRFEAKFNQKVEDLTTWTPENISEDPVGYLRYALAEFDNIESKLRARRFALVVQKSEVEGDLRVRKDVELPPRMKVLEELKADYREGDKNGNYVVSSNNDVVSKDEFQQLILEGDTRVRETERDIRTYTRYLGKVESEIERTDEMLRELQSKRAEVQKQLEYVKLDQSINDYTALREKVNSVLTTTKAVREEKSARISFDDLVERDKEAQIDKGQAERFSRIMQGN